MSASLHEPLGAPLGEALRSTGSSERGESPARNKDSRDSRDSRVELRAQLRGVGMWTPAHADFDAWVAAGMPELDALARELEGEDPRPPATLLHPRLRRRTSTLTRAAVTALEAALGQGGASMDTVRFVLVSSFGEIQTTVDLLAQLGEPEGPVSPTKFHNSVHNTATGYMSIASGNHREATALAGGPHNLEVGLLEALTGLAETGGDVVLLFAEEALPSPFARDDADPTFAVALHLSADRPGPEQGTSLDIELRVSSRGAAVGPATRALARGVGGSGLPSMAAPLIELLRGIAGVGRGDGAAGKRSIALAPGCDPAVEAEWTASLHPR